MDAEPSELVRRALQILDYVRKGGVAPEDALQIAAAMDMLEAAEAKLLAPS